MTVGCTIYSPALERKWSRDADMRTTKAFFGDESGRVHRGGRSSFCLSFWQHDSLKTSPISCRTLREAGNMISKVRHFGEKVIQVLKGVKNEVVSDSCIYIFSEP